jgi:hypothetical protein
VCDTREMAAHADLPIKFEFIILELAALDLDGA